MGFFSIIKTLNFKQLLSLTKIFIYHPLMLFPTIKATVICYRVSDKLYPELHHLNNEANAFRHALWNALLIKETIKWNKNLSKAVLWSKKITDWHEHFSPNKPLEKMMDLHNNKIGRKLFEELYLNKKKIYYKDIIDVLKEKALKSKKVTAVEEIKNCENDLVHLPTCKVSKTL